MTKSIDFSRGRRGVFANRKIVVIGAIDEAQPARSARRRNPPALVVVIEDDLRRHFPTAKDVNEALRALAAEFDRRDTRTTAKGASKRRRSAASFN